MNLITYKQSVRGLPVGIMPLKWKRDNDDMVMWSEMSNPYQYGRYVYWFGV